MLKKCIEKVRHSITARILLITALMLFLACGITYAFISWTTPEIYTDVVTEATLTAADDLAARLTGKEYIDAKDQITRFTADTSALVTVITPEGTVDESLSTVTLHKDTDMDNELANSGTVTMVTLTGENGMVSSWYTVGMSESLTYSIFFSDREGEYHLCVFSGVQQVNLTEEALLRVLPGLIVVVLIISMIGAAFYSRYIAKPIVQMSAISQQMASLDFSKKWQMSRQDEIGMLGENLNRLSDNLYSALDQLQTANKSLQADIDLEREREQQRAAFFAAASHELKTPLTVVKGQLSAMLEGVGPYQDRDKYLAKALTVTERMETLIREMLEIARLEPGEADVLLEAVDLSALIRGLSSDALELAMLKSQGFTADIAEDIRIDGDRRLLERAISNLLSNAVFYSPEHADIFVSLTQESDAAVLRVVNSGVVIPDEALPHLFEAFYRVETSRSRAAGGSGLGLYLAKTIFDRHGASYCITNTEGGVCAVVSFPNKSSM